MTRRYEVSRSLRRQNGRKSKLNKNNLKLLEEERSSS